MSLRTAPAPLFTLLEARFGFWVSDTVPPTSYSDFINNEKLEISAPEQEIKKLISRMTSTQGAAIDSQSVPTEKTAQVTLTASTFTPDLQAIALGATVSEVTQTAAAVASEAVNTVLGMWVPLANYAIAAAGTGTEIALVTSSDVAVAATKYEIDHVLGMIKATHADAVGVGMKLSYHPAAGTWEQYQGGLALNKYVHITGQAKNQVSGKIGDLDIWRANLAPAGTFDATGGDYLRVELSGDMLVPSVAVRGFTPGAPYRFRVRTA
jgi:hypothetical protein